LKVGLKGCEVGLLLLRSIWSVEAAEKRQGTRSNGIQNIGGAESGLL